MSKENFNESVSSLMKGLDGYVTTKTVVGEPIFVGETVVIPMSDVQFGMGAGSFGTNNNAGGMTGKVTPSAVLVIQNGTTRLINIKNQDSMSTLIDMIPGIIDKFTHRNDELDPEVKATIDDIKNK